MLLFAWANISVWVIWDWNWELYPKIQFLQIHLLDYRRYNRLDKFLACIQHKSIEKIKQKVSYLRDSGVSIVGSLFYDLLLKCKQFHYLSYRHVEFFLSHNFRIWVPWSFSEAFLATFLGLLSLGHWLFWLCAFCLKAISWATRELEYNALSWHLCSPQSHQYHSRRWPFFLSHLPYRYRFPLQNPSHGSLGFLLPLLHRLSRRARHSNQQNRHLLGVKRTRHCHRRRNHRFRRNPLYQNNSLTDQKSHHLVEYRTHPCHKHHYMPIPPLTYTAWVAEILSFYLPYLLII